MLTFNLPLSIALGWAAGFVLAGSLLTADVAAQSVHLPDAADSPFRPEPVKLAAIGVPIHPEVAPSPDGRHIAVLQTRPAPVLWIVPADGGEPFAYREMWAAYNPRWSPSGDRIGFIAGIGPPRIWTIDVDPASGRPMAPPRLLYRAAANVYAFAPDGERIAFVSRRSTAAGASEIYVIEWKTRRVRFVLRESGMIYRLDWVGEHLYYGVAPAASDSAHRVVRAPVGGGRRETLLRVREFLGLSPDGLALLYRVDDLEAIRRNALEIANADGAPLGRIVVPRGSTPTWAASSVALLQVQPQENGAGDAIVTIPSPVAWRFFW
jgi:hypothetical protein